MPNSSIDFIVSAMKSIVPIVVLLMLSVVLGGALLKQRSDAAAKSDEDAETITGLTEEVASLTGQLDEQKQVNQVLETKFEDEVKAKNQFQTLLLAARKEREAAEKLAQSDLTSAKEEIKAKEEQISDLTNQIDDSAIKMAALNVSISNLEAQISATQEKLEDSEEDRDFLLRELKRLQEEKNQLERKFNDLKVLQEHVKKLREEISIQKRLDWVKRSVFRPGQRKGGQLLKEGFGPDTPAAPPSFDLEVELRPDTTPVIRAGEEDGQGGQ